MRIVALVCMLLLAFGTGRNTLRQGVLFLLVSLALAGLVLLVAALFDWGLIILNQTVYYPVNAPALIITAGLGYLAADFALRRCAQHGGGEVLQATVWLEEQKAVLSVLRDTGNTLRDPMTNQPVLIVYWKAVQSLLPELSDKALQQPVDTFEHLVKCSPQRHWRLLPYRAVGVEGVLLAFRASQVQLDQQMLRHMTVALSPTPVSDGGAYLGLLGGKQ